MFDTFHTFDSAQATFMPSNSHAYTTYAGNLQQYSNSTNASFSDNWNLSDTSTGYNATSHPRRGVSNPSLSPHPAQTSSFNRGGYSPYTPPSTSYKLSEPRRPRTGYQGLHSSGMNHPRIDEGAYFMFSPGLSGLPSNHHPLLPMAGNTGRERGATWEDSRTTLTGHPLRAAADIPPEIFGWSPHPEDNQFMAFDPPWNDSLSSPLISPADIHLLAQEYNNYALEVSPISPPQPRSAATYALRHVSPTSSSSSPPTSRHGSVDISPSGKVCSHCQATSTPLWRREPSTLKPLCNACGLYLQQRNKHRPQELIDADAADDSDESDGDASGPECSHCHTHHTSVWRRSKTGAQLCNACGVYLRLRGRDRPLSLKRNKIKPRSKHTPPAASKT